MERGVSQGGGVAAKKALFLDKRVLLGLGS